MSSELIPLLTEYDPATSSEGGIDPLGLYAIGDSLAVQLVPGVRERQVHPRFLTAIAAGAIVCSDFDIDAVANDGVSEPWQVFEWYVVEGMVRAAKDGGEIKGLPGRRKAYLALKDEVHLSGARYLKTPGTFGFHGVYRTLAEDLDVVCNGRVGEVGYQLVTIWAEERGLNGFCGGDSGPGAEIRRKLYKAVRDGLEVGAVDREGGWSGWEFFSTHLDHHRFERREAEFVCEALMNPSAGYRKEIIEFLLSPEGQSIVQTDESERRFHKALVERASPGLKSLLKAILLYETFSRLFEDAFKDCLQAMTMSGGRKTSTMELAKLQSVREASDGMPAIFSELSDRLKDFGEAIRFENAFASVAERTTPAEWVKLLVDHHHAVQRNKPPNGKSPWFERMADGSAMIRPRYATDTGGRHDGSYVQAYRTEPLWRFLEDLGKL